MKFLSHTLIASAVAGALMLAGSSAFAQTTPDDAQIAGIVVAANTVDIDAGKVAQKMSRNADVKAFAKMMVTDHTGVNKQAIALVKKLKVKPQEGELSKSLKQGGRDNIRKLRALKGKDFDKAYIEHEIVYHQTVIDTLDKTLIPHATNAELKQTLVNVRPAFVAHLEQAKGLQAKLN